MAVQIQAKLRKDDADYDGLAPIADELISEPMKPRTVVARIEVVGYQVNLADGGTKTPKVRIVAIEPLEGDMADDARRLLDKAYTQRTGQAAPPPTLFDDDADLTYARAGIIPDDEDQPGDGEQPGEDEQPAPSVVAETMASVTELNKRPRKRASKKATAAAAGEAESAGEDGPLFSG